MINAGKDKNNPYLCHTKEKINNGENTLLPSPLSCSGTHHKPIFHRKHPQPIQNLRFPARQPADRTAYPQHLLHPARQRSVTAGRSRSPPSSPPAAIPHRHATRHSLRTSRYVPPQGAVHPPRPAKRLRAAHSSPETASPHAARHRPRPPEQIRRRHPHLYRIKA